VGKIGVCQANGYREWHRLSDHPGDEGDNQAAGVPRGKQRARHMNSDPL